MFGLMRALYAAVTSSTVTSDQVPGTVASMHPPGASGRTSASASGVIASVPPSSPPSVAGASPPQPTATEKEAWRRAQERAGGMAWRIFTGDLQACLEARAATRHGFDDSWRSFS